MRIHQITYICSSPLIVNFLAHLCVLSFCSSCFVFLSVQGYYYVSSYSPQCLIWILGHLYFFGGAKRVDVRPEGRQLGVARGDCRVRWIGVPGMMWHRVIPEIHRFARLDQPPDILVLHVGGNDLGLRLMRQVIKDIQWDFLSFD